MCSPVGHPCAARTEVLLLRFQLNTYSHHQYRHELCFVKETEKYIYSALLPLNRSDLSPLNLLVSSSCDSL